GLRGVRVLPAASARFRRGRRAGSDPLSHPARGEVLMTTRPRSRPRGFVLVLALGLLSPGLHRVRAQEAGNPSASASAPAAQGPFPVERYLRVRSASSPAISPSGARAAFLTGITG